MELALSTSMGGKPESGAKRHPQQAEGQWILRAARGDTAAFEWLVARHQRRILRLAWRYLGRESDAQDAVQETFLRLYRSLPKIDPARPLAPWLCRVALNVCRDSGRRRTRRDQLEVAQEDGAEDVATPEVNPEQHAARAELGRRVGAALQQLPEKERAALILRDIEGFSTREVAQLLGSTEPTVRSQICRARLKMRQLRGQLLGESPEGAEA